MTSTLEAENVHVVSIGGFGRPPVRAYFLRGPKRARIEAQLREELKPWGLPLHRYRFTVEASERPTYQDHHGQWQGWWRTISLQATFTHRGTGAKITITEIWTDDNGEILQWGTQYGDLTL